MDFKTYQAEAIKTAIYNPKDKIMYPILGLTNEAGEVAGKLKKIYRDESGEFTQEGRQKIADELGDVLWYIAAIARDIEIPMETIAQANLDKLRDRQERNVLGGSGDNR